MAPPPTPPHFAKVPEHTLLIVTWVLFGITALLSAVRLTLRFLVERRLRWDDFFAAVALGILLSNAVVLTLALPDMYQLMAVGAKVAKPKPTFMADSTYYLKSQFASTMLFWSILWAVKASFLMYFRTLTGLMRPIRLAWWAVVIFTFLAYIGSMISYPISCTSFVLGTDNQSPSAPFEILTPTGQCNSPRHVRRASISLRFSTAVDIISDVLIMSIPFAVGFQFKRPLNQKLLLYCMFGLGFVIVLFAVIRIIVTDNGGSDPELSWLNLWSVIESSIAVQICNLAPFRSAIVMHRHRTTAQGTYGNGYSHTTSGNCRVESIPLSSRSLVRQDNGTINVKTDVEVKRGFGSEPTVRETRAYS